MLSIIGDDAVALFYLHHLGVATPSLIPVLIVTLAGCEPVAANVKPRSFVAHREQAACLQAAGHWWMDHVFVTGAGLSSGIRKRRALFAISKASSRCAEMMETSLHPWFQFQIPDCDTNDSVVRTTFAP